MGLWQLLDGDQTWLGSNDNDSSQQPTITTITNNSNNSSKRHVKQTIVETSEEIIAVFGKVQSEPAKSKGQECVQVSLLWGLAISQVSWLW